MAILVVGTAGAGLSSNCQAEHDMGSLGFLSHDVLTGGHICLTFKHYVTDVRYRI